MQVVQDRKGVVIAMFAHYSDAVQFVLLHTRHGYERTDEPGMDAVICEYVTQPRVDDGKKRACRENQ